MIPLSIRIDKYRQIMEKKEKAGKPCDILHKVHADAARHYDDIGKIIAGNIKAVSKAAQVHVILLRPIQFVWYQNA